jgi:hypothetical protein
MIYDELSSVGLVQSLLLKSVNRPAGFWSRKELKYVREQLISSKTFREEHVRKEEYLCLPLFSVNSSQATNNDNKYNFSVFCRSS